jgi:hypothetical protein
VVLKRREVWIMMGLETSGAKHFLFVYYTYLMHLCHPSVKNHFHGLATILATEYGSPTSGFFPWSCSISPCKFRQYFLPLKNERLR